MIDKANAFKGLFTTDSDNPSSSITYLPFL
jgi:hypothetical protein